MTAKYVLWRACERFGIDPRSAGHMEPGFVSSLLAYAEIRREEDIRRDEAMAGAL